TLERAAAEYEHEVLITPGREPSAQVLSRLLASGNRTELYRYTSVLAFDLTPPTDDRPFFFNQLPLSRPLQAFAYAQTVLARGPLGGGVRKGNLVATATLLVLFLIALILVFGTIVVPLRFALKDAGVKFVSRGTLYFSLIGAGFMMVEIGLMQRMSIFLGHPIYSLSVLLFTLILATGLGSLISEKFPLNSRTRISTWAIVTGTYLIVLPFSLTFWFVTYANASLAVRIAICVASVAPAGILLGFGFPTGMRVIASIDPAPTPWFWGINGAAGVLASITAVALSLALGINATLVVGAICYFLLVPVSLSLLQLKPTPVAKRASKREVKHQRKR
ncbi:MAG: hypothetical protein ACREO5_15240, partial [Candidatus Binatia bacterium]